MDDTDDLDVLDDTIYRSMPISRHRMESFLVRIDEIGRDGEVLNSTRRFEGIDSAQDVAKIIEDHKRLTAENATLKAQLAWDDERRNTLGSLLESYAHTHRQFYFPARTEFDTLDSDVEDDLVK
jgi:hypothetical protein